jgi:dTDP-4-dehydrorhamnose reductase
MRHQGMEVWTTSRRKGSAKLRSAINLDLSAPGDFRLPVVPDSAFLCAARSGFDDCNKSSGSTYRVNVTGSIAVAKHLLSRGVFVVFLSSSAVFDGMGALRTTESELSPSTAYGRQKAEAERKLVDLDQGKGQVAIVRLTKVFSPATPVIERFMEHLKSGTGVDAFSDVYISPVSLPYVIGSLLEIERRRISGIFHLSGSAELSYADFARRLAVKLVVSPDLVREASVEESPARVLYRPLHPALDMSLTKQTLGLTPEPIDAMLANLLGDASGRS